MRGRSSGLGGWVVRGASSAATTLKSVDGLTDVPQIAGAVAAGIAIFTAVAAGLRRTLLRRIDFKRRLRRLGVNVQEDFFAAILGAAPAFRTTHDPISGREATRGTLTWVDRLAYVVALVNGEGTVTGYSVTSRRRFFRPELRPPRVRGERTVRLLVRLLPSACAARLPEIWRWRAAPLFATVRLCATTFAAAGEVDGQSASVGARHFYYHEARYYGNPGLYLNYVLAINTAGYIGSRVLAGTPRTLLENRYALDPVPEYALGNQDAEIAGVPEVVEFRRRARPNTFAVTNDAPGRTEFGPVLDLVRTLP